MTLSKLLAGIGLLCLVAVMAACGAPASAPLLNRPTPEVTLAVAAISGNSLINMDWTLSAYGKPGAEAALIPGSTITLKLQENGRADGFGGCNLYQTQYQVKQNGFIFSPPTSTRKACSDAAVIQQEQQFFNALTTSGSFELSQNRLAISYNNGQSVLIFVRTP